MTTTIRAQLYKQGKTFQWLADRLQVTAGTVAKWMRGVRPRYYSTMRKCADLLLCEPADIWPEVRQPIDWARRYEVITARLMELDTVREREEFIRLCSERAAASVHIYIANLKRKQDCGGYDEYLLPMHNA